MRVARYRHCHLSPSLLVSITAPRPTRPFQGRELITPGCPLTSYKYLSGLDLQYIFIFLFVKKKCRNHCFVISNQFNSLCLRLPLPHPLVLEITLVSALLVVLLICKKLTCLDEPLLMYSFCFPHLLADAGWYRKVCFHMTGNPLFDRVEQVPSCVWIVLGTVFIQVMQCAICSVQTRCSILVELLCCTKEHFLSLVEDFEKGIVKRRLEEEFEKVGCKGELELTITNEEEVYEALGEIR